MEIGEAFVDAFSNLRQNLATAIWGIIATAAVLIAVGLFAMASMIVSSTLGDVESQVTINAFVDDAADQETIDAYMDELRGMENVREVSFTDKDQAWQDYRKTIGEESADRALEALDGVNPLPASIVVKMHEPEQVAAVAEAIERSETFASIADEGVVAGNVVYGKKTVDSLIKFVDAVRYAMLVFIAILIGVAYILISNTIRNSVVSRGNEIGIQRLVGASKHFIRRPFVIEGIFQSLIGGLVAVGALAAFQHVAIPKVQSTLSFLRIGISGGQYMVIYVSILVTAIGIGTVASVLAMRKYLRT